MILARGPLAALFFASGAVWAQTPPPPEPENSDLLFEVVEQSPELIGGIADLQRRVVYPEMARRAGTEGRVFVQFVVNEKGEVQDVVCARSPDELLCEAASEAVRNSRFRPGMQEGRAVKVRFTLPVDFKLRDPEDDLVIEDEIIEDIEMDLRTPPPVKPPPSRALTPGAVLPALLGSTWRADLFSDLAPPRSGTIKNGNGALVFDDRDPDVDRVVAHVTDGVFDAFDVAFIPSVGGELQQMRSQAEAEFGAPDPDGFFSLESLGSPIRLRVSPEAGTMRFEHDPDADIDLRPVAPPPPPPAYEEPPPKASGEPEVFEMVEQSPELIGGLPELQRRVMYPEEARRAGIEGRVFVQFVVDERGNVTEAVCARSPDELLCDAAIEAVRGSQFRPGLMRGRPVKVRYALPVTFYLR